MKVTKEDLIGQLTGVPIEVAQLMIEEQVLQGNPADVMVFQHAFISHKNEKGFDWRETRQGDYEWTEAWRGNYIPILEWIEKNKPKSEESYTFPCLMWVGFNQNHMDTKENKRVGFMKKEGKFLAWADATSFEEAETVTGATVWDYATPVQKVVVTKQQIAEKFGCDVEDLKILE
jgi:hypothetical protein